MFQEVGSSHGELCSLGMQPWWVLELKSENLLPGEMRLIFHPFPDAVLESFVLLVCVWRCGGFFLCFFFLG